MTTVAKLAFLILMMAAILFLPWLGSYFYYHGDFPDNFFAYPPLTFMEKPGYNVYIFVFVAICCAGISAIYVFPRLFGFRKVSLPVQPEKPHVGLPYWFWFGLLLWGTSLAMLAFKVKHPVWFVHWSDIPLFWGFTLMLDGWVYKRNGGKSLVSVIPQELIGIGMASMSGWMIFEFLNFFVDDNWYYPWGNILDREEFLLYAFFVSSGLLPLSFEWYLVFKSFPKFNVRFSDGIKIVLSTPVKYILLIVSLGFMFASGLYPDKLFFTLWVGPPVILAVVLDRIGIWTPFHPIGKGNWGPALLSCLTYFVTGLCLEGQNYLSASHAGQTATFTMDPAYWQYSLPYVNVLHLFEMPLLGFWGYLPFGVYCWLWWIAFATLLNIPAVFLKEDPLGQNPIRE